MATWECEDALEYRRGELDEETWCSLFWSVKHCSGTCCRAGWGYKVEDTNIKPLAAILYPRLQVPTICSTLVIVIAGVTTYIPSLQASIKLACMARYVVASSSKAQVASCLPAAVRSPLVMDFSFDVMTVCFGHLIDTMLHLTEFRTWVRASPNSSQ